MPNSYHVRCITGTADGLPATVRFARMVDDALTMGCAKGEEEQPFNSYV